jgi:hypothetical protein
VSIIRFLLYCFALFSLFSPNQALAEFYADHLTKGPHFWKSPEVQEQLDKKRKVVVSSRHFKREKDDNWIIKGVGRVNVPVKFAWQEIKDFSNLKKISKVFRKVKYVPKTNMLYLNLDLDFGVIKKQIYVAAHLQYKTQGTSNEIHWINKDGFLVGMKGVIHCEDVGRRKTEIFMTAEYKKGKISIPGWIMSFGMESVLHYVATRLRSVLEEKYSAQ